MVRSLIYFIFTSECTREFRESITSMKICQNESHRLAYNKTERLAIK